MATTTIKKSCAHCGDVCPDRSIQLDNNYFCCQGCKSVYEILDSNNLCGYYSIDSIKPFKARSLSGKYDFLENKEISCQLLSFQSEEMCTVDFLIPGIHCSSCLWLLEKLYKLHEGILRSEVNFTKKRVHITYNPKQIDLQGVAILLEKINYPPSIQLADASKEKLKDHTSRKMFVKLGVTGFLFGNIMMLSFPEYLGLDTLEQDIIHFINMMNVLLSVPAVLVGGMEYFLSSWKAIKGKRLNIDVPIALGIATLFVESLYQIISGSGPGYWDSLSGLVFFLLLGKWFQNLTYQHLSFERDFKSYFPLSVFSVLNQKYIPIQSLKKGDIIKVKNEDIIPADSTLLHGEALIDYSFVTGESQPVFLKEGEKIYAGGKQTGGTLELEVDKKVSSSYLTQLWEKATGQKESVTKSKLDALSYYFTPAILMIALSAFIFWQLHDASVAWTAFSSVLIVACPCALALSVPFTYGNIIRILGKNGIFLKNSQVLESLSKINHVVFDKTGTLTHHQNGQVTFSGNLTEQTRNVAGSLAAHSNHPASRKIFAHLSGFKQMDITNIQEIPGAGISGFYQNHEIRLGSWEFVGLIAHQNGTFFRFDDKIIGHFSFEQHWRKGLEQTLNQLTKEQISISLLSGDIRPEEYPEFLPKESYFQQSPFAKRQHIDDLLQHKKQVMMIGDGLNDAGALNHSNVGIAITDDKASFTPSSDVILEGKQLTLIPNLLGFAKKGKKIISLAIVLSAIYNLIGLSVAVSGNLSPVFAAILMPISSITVVIFTTLASNYYGVKLAFNKNELK